MSRPSSESRHIAIAAIDFGTTCTGYAYYLRKEAGNQIQEINTDQAWMGSAELGLQAPTTVLMKPNMQFDSFGFEAESKYKRLTLKKEHRAWFYFQHFKMKLHHETIDNEDAASLLNSKFTLDPDMLLTDVEGKTMKAMLIFTEAIRYVKRHLMEKLKKSIMGEIGEQDITWVLTVPAIWRHSAKQFMRDAATTAGIPDDELTLALEPESAAIFCKEVTMRKTGGIEGVFLRAFDPGQKHIVVDLGGGTVDSTCHEVLSDGSLKELHAATGGPFGGQTVNEAFEQYIAKMFNVACLGSNLEGVRDLQDSNHHMQIYSSYDFAIAFFARVTPKVFEKFCKDYLSDWIEFKKDFEKKKRSFTKNTEEVDLNFPVDLEKLYQDEYEVELATRLKDNEYKNKAEHLKRSLVLKPAVMERFFSKAINELIGLIQSLLKKKELKSVSSILLVGGFSESHLVNSSVRGYFRSLRVIAPEHASVAILKGAVMFGNNPRIICSRMSPFTYGVHTRKIYNPEIHPPNRRKRINGKDYVDDAFDIHLKAGEHVFVGDSSRERKYKITNRKNAEVFWTVYQSENPDPKFCDDIGCVKLGKLELSLSDDIPGNVTSLTLSMTCRGTELEASAAVVGHDISCRVKFEFLADQHAISGDEFLIETEA